MTEKNKSQKPKHIGFIMDGNGRWAKRRGMPRKFGHSEGAKALKEIVNYCKKIEIPYVTLYVFSTENWKRPDDEVEAIMDLLRKYLNDAYSRIGSGVRFVFLGDKGRFAPDIQQIMYKLEEESKVEYSLTLLLAINYGGRDDLLFSFKNIARKISFGELKAENITESIISENLYTAGIPDVDFIIRTSGEQRLSNFLIWQGAYAELYFTDTYWPDFSPKELDKALLDFSNRKRKYGGIS
ncbi:MAG: di-trans,poly-cis-decaprenylcistransferase [Oscillospiraceae bacterium]|jgi:undecaprenyl diphosphate synthase|nr:di-trans,poly-cis-decaprenylcistransferase [Oscillospiraceae bacterium]